MFDILYEDNHIIVVKKPFNVPVMADESRDGDMLSIIKAYLKEKYSKPGNVYLGLVHRLDRPTGGVMVFAKTSKAAERISKEIKERAFEKKYYAVLKSRPRELTGVLRNYLLKDERTNTVSVVPRSIEGAKYAELSYRILDYNDNLSLADIDLFTGRSHQIRVQFKYIKAPVFGDIRYGDAPSIAQGKGVNMALWAYHIRFTHPTTKETMVFRTAPPFTEFPWSEFSALESTFEDIIKTGEAVKLT